MENKTKAQKELSKKPEEKSTSKKLKFALAFLAGSALSGCGDTIINNYYTGPDGGQKPDTTLKADSGVKPDSLAPDTFKSDSKPECVADKSCVVSDEKVTIELKTLTNPTTVSTLKEGESSTVSGYTIKVISIDETVAVDGSCSVTNKKVTAEITSSEVNQQITLFDDGSSVAIKGIMLKVLGLNVGINGLNCSNSSNLAQGTLNQGELLSLGKYKVVFDDGQQVGDKVYALLNVTDSCGTSVDKLKVEEGKSALLTLNGQKLQITADEVAVGTTFAAKWAKLSVKNPCETLPSTCSSNATALQCSDTVPLASGVLNQGESLQIKSAPGTVKYQLQLDDGQVLNGKNYAIVSLLDSCGNVLAKKKIEESTTLTFSISGEQFEVTVNSAAFGITFGAKWADITVKAPCTTTYWCSSVMGILNQGDSLSVDSYKIQLDDLANLNGVSYALLSVLDANGNTVTKTKIAEGSSADVTLGGKTLRLSVPEVAPGYTFGAKWAKVDVQSPYSKPCDSP